MLLLTNELRILSQIVKLSPFSHEGSTIAIQQGVGDGATPFPGLLHFTLDPYLIMLIK